MKVLVLTRLLWVGVAVGALFYLALSLWLAFSGMFFRYQLDYGEGTMLWFTRQLAAGQQIYRGIEGPPFVIANYPPLAMLLAALGYPLFGDSFIVGRWLNFASALLIASVIIRLVRDYAPSTERVLSLPVSLAAGILAASLFLGSTFIYHWIPLFRADLPGLLFVSLGLLAISRWERAIRNKRIEDIGKQTKAWSLSTAHSSLYLVAALGFFLAALYTKHSFIFAPAAAAVAIFIKDRRAAVIWSTALALIGGVLFLILDWSTQGGWSFGLITANATVWRLEIFARLVQSFLLTFAVLLVLAAWSFLRRIRARTLGILELYAAAALVAIALAGREGAWENYFFEAVFAACVFAGLAFAELLADQGRWSWALPALLLLQLGLFWNEHDPRIALQLFRQLNEGGEILSPIIRRTTGTIISEDNGLLVLNGKPIVYYSFPYSTLARANKWDQKWELDQLRSGSIPLVILKQGTRLDVDRERNFTRAFVSALDYSYASQPISELYEIYTPAPIQHSEPRAVFGDQFELVGWSLDPPLPSPGQTAELSLVWRALKTVNTRYTAFAHLEDADGDVIVQDDHEPKRGAYPTVLWADGEMVRDTFTLKLPPTLPAGAFALRIGWYDTATQDTLADQNGAEKVQLGTITVK